MLHFIVHPQHNVPFCNHLLVFWLPCLTLALSFGFLEFGFMFSFCLLGSLIFPVFDSHLPVPVHDYLPADLDIVNKFC